MAEVELGACGRAKEGKGERKKPLCGMSDVVKVFTSSRPSVCSSSPLNKVEKSKRRRPVSLFLSFFFCSRIWCYVRVYEYS